MKKLYILALLALFVPSITQAYTVRPGDTPYGLWGANWKTELASYGITDPRKLPVGLEIEDQLGATTKIKLTDPNSVTPAATSTPTAGMIPIANATAGLEDWVTSTRLLSAVDKTTLTSASTSDASALHFNQSYTVTSSANLKQSADTERSGSPTGYTKIKEIKVNVTGNIKISFDLKTNNAGDNAAGKIYKNGSAFGSEELDNTGSYVTKNMTGAAVTAGDLIQLYYDRAAAAGVSVRNFRIYYDRLMGDSIINLD